MEAQYSTIFDYITRQEIAFKQPVSVNTKDWNFKDHVIRSALYRDSDIVGMKNDFVPIRNITRPILNLNYRTEDIDVKDIQIYVDEPDAFHLSFLVKKYFEDVFVVENDLDSFIDSLNQSRIDFGGGLSKSLSTPCPEVVPLQSIAFCDQTDILSGPIGIKHYYSPDQLLAMADRGWGNPANGATASLEELISLSRDQKSQNKDSTVVRTPGRYVEVYEVHGNLPKKFADPEADGEIYETRIYIVAFYQRKNSNEKFGVVLYTAPETESPFKFVSRDPIFGRALGFGGAEELFEAQVWVNYDQIRMQRMLEAASITLLQSDDPSVAQKNKISGMQNLEIIDYAPGTHGISQVPTFPTNMKLFEQSVLDWETHAQTMGAAQDSITGESPSSGTPFSSLKQQVIQSMGLHEYRRGKFAKHLESIFKDWIIPYIEKEITKGTTFLSELSLDEVQYVTDAVVTCETNKMIIEQLLGGADAQTISQIVPMYQQQIRDNMGKKGNKHFIEILKGEFNGYDLGVKVNIAGKEKDLVDMVDKLTNVFRAVSANPYILQAPAMAKLFNKIIEASGLDPIDLSQFKVPRLPAMRVTETVAFKDLPPEAQKEMIETLGYAQNQGNTGNPAPQGTALGAQLP